MKPTTAAALALAFLLGPTIAITAQEAPADKARPGQIAAARPAAIEKGDQAVSLAVDVNMPLFVLNPDLTLDGKAANIYPGAAFTVTYQRYLAHGLAVGGGIAASFNSTIGGKNFILVPMTLRTSYTWIVAGSLEIGLALDAGAYLMFYNGQTLVDPLVKAGPTFSWRVANSWSVGMDVGYVLTPEIHFAVPSQTRIGNALDVGITATYHL